MTLQVKEIKSEGTRKHFNVTVDATVIEKKIENRLAEIQKTATMQGFRPGKVPLAVLKKRYGGQLMGEVLGATVQETSQEAINKQKLEPVGQPKIEIKKYKEGEPLEYILQIDSMPNFKIANFSEIKLQKLNLRVTPDLIDKRLSDLAEQQKKFVKKDGAKAKKGDAINLDYKGTINDKEFEGSTAKSANVVLGSGMIPPTLDDQLVGSKAGDKLTLQVKFPNDYYLKEAAGNRAVYTCQIHEVKQGQKAQIDNEFAKNLGVEDLTKLKSLVKDQIKLEYEQYSKENLKRKLLDNLDTKHSFVVPKSMVDDEYQRITKPSPASGAKDDKQIKKPELDPKEAKELKIIAERRIKLALLFMKLAKDNNIQVSDQEIEQGIKQYAKQYPGKEKEIFDYFAKTPQARSDLSGPMFEAKVVEFILSKANIKEKEVSLAELTKDFEGGDKKKQNITSTKDKKKVKGSKGKK